MSTVRVRVRNDKRGKRDNPWRLNDQHCAVLDSLCRVGRRKAIMADTRLSADVVGAAIQLASERMAVCCVALVAVTWDRYRRSTQPKE